MAKKVTEATLVAAFAFTLDGDKLSSMVEAIIAKSAGIVTEIQITVVSLAIKCAKDGNTGLMQRLDDGLGQGFHRNTLRRWAVKHGPFTYLTKATDKAKAGYSYVKEKGDKLLADLATDNAGTMSRLMDEKWEEQEKEPEFGGYSLLKILKRGVAQAEKIKADASKNGHEGNDFRGILETKRLIALLEGKVPSSEPESSLPAIAIPDAGNDNEIAVTHH